MKLVAFNGSARGAGNTSTMLERFFEPLRQGGVECEQVQLCSYRLGQVCDLDKHRSGEDPYAEFIDKMLLADAVVFASPAYFADVTPEMKGLIDRTGLYCQANGFPLARKPAAAIVTGRRGGLIHALDTINHLFLCMGMFLVGSTGWNIGHGLAKGDVAEDAEAMATMDALGANMLWLMQGLQGR